jgi:hypothetical protein
MSLLRSLSTALTLAASAIGQATWIQRITSKQPSPSLRGAMVYHWKMRAVLYCVGVQQTIPVGMQVWKWDGVDWQLLTQGSGPNAREAFAVTYDSRRDRVVLFGGLDWHTGGGYEAADTWEWDGSRWRQILSQNAPPARYGHKLVFDWSLGQCVLYGGSGRQVPADARTWSWDGSDWRVIANAGSGPGTLLYHGMTYDAAGRRLLLFGGSSWKGLSNDLWEWTQAGGWREVSIDGQRPPAGSHEITCDLRRRRILLFGGGLGTRIYARETWEHDGVHWTQLSPLLSPSARSGHAAEYDLQRGRLVLHGGFINSGRPDETWELLPRCEIAGPGRVGGGTAALICRDEPVLGRPFGAEFANPNWPQALVILSARACQARQASGFGLCAGALLQASQPPGVFFAATGDPGTVRFPVPNDPSLAGFVFCLQAARLGAARCVELTDGLQGIVSLR